jgi:hypothetical protein
MRLIPRHRQRHQRPKAPQIPFSQAEITADLFYPALRRPARSGQANGAGEGSR